MPQTMISSPQSLSQSKPFGVLIHGKRIPTQHTHTHTRRSIGEEKRKEGLVHLLTGSRPPSRVCLVLPLMISTSIREEVLFYGHIEMSAHTHTQSRCTKLCHMSSVKNESLGSEVFVNQEMNYKKYNNMLVLTCRSI